MNDKIIDKVRKLLARADEARNDNEHERAIAMRQAHALLAKHGLALADVETADEAAAELGALGKGKVELATRAVWERGVYTAIARLHGCHAVQQVWKGQSPKIFIIGRRLRVNVVRELAAYVVASIQREGKAWGRDSTAFGVGAWTGVAKQVDIILAQQARGEIGEERVSQSTALVLVNQHKQALAEAQGATKEFFPNTRDASYRHTGNRDAMSAGRAYGEKVGLNIQIGGNSQRKLGSLSGLI